MGWLEGIINGVSGTIQQSIQNRFNRKEAKKQRDWSANEAALQRDWSSQEAERARDWQEEMNAKYNSLSGKIAQAEQAGVNPMFAVTGQAVSPASASTSVPSGASASGASASSTSQFVDIVGAILNARKTRAEIDLMNAEAEKQRADTNVALQMLPEQIRNMESSTALNWQKVQESVTSVDKIKVDMGLSQTQAELFASQMDYLFQQTKSIEETRDSHKRKLEAEALYSEWMEKNKELFKGVDIGLDVLNVAANIGSAVLSAKTGNAIANRPIVAGPDSRIYHPSDIVH